MRAWGDFGDRVSFEALVEGRYNRMPNGIGQSHPAHQICRFVIRRQLYLGHTIFWSKFIFFNATRGVDKDLHLYFFSPGSSTLEASLE